MSRKKSVSGEDKPLTAFLRKLYEIVNTAPRSLVSWSSKGEAFVVRDPKLFSNEVLSKYFKSSNFASFVRQLHFYGFHKTDKDKNLWEFRHEHFQPNRIDLLSLIKRKTSASGEESGGKRELEGLKQEVSELRHELVSVRSTLTKVLSVLNTLVNEDGNNLPPSKKRKIVTTVFENEGLDWLNESGGIGMPPAELQLEVPQLSRTRSSEMWKQSFQQRDEFMEDVLTDFSVDTSPRPHAQERFTLQRLEESLADAVGGLEPPTPVGQKDNLMSGFPLDSSFPEINFSLSRTPSGVKDETLPFSPTMSMPMTSAPTSFQSTNVPVLSSFSASPSGASAVSSKMLPDWAALRQLSQQLPAELKAQLTSNLLPELAEELFPGANGSSAAASVPHDPQKALPPAAVIAAIASVFSSGQVLTPSSQQLSSAVLPGAQAGSTPQLGRTHSFQNFSPGVSNPVTPQQIQSLFVSLLMPQVQLALISKLKEKGSFHV